MSKNEIKLQMEYASSYETWLEAAEKLDVIEGKILLGFITNGTRKISMERAKGVR